jgi:hypothetical protein
VTPDAVRGGAFTSQQVRPPGIGIPAATLALAALAGLAIAFGTAALLVVVAVAGVAVVAAVVRHRWEPLLLVSAASLVLPSTQASRYLMLWGTVALLVAAAVAAGVLRHRTPEPLRWVLVSYAALCGWLALSAVRAVDMPGAVTTIVFFAVIAALTWSVVHLGIEFGVERFGLAFVAASAAASLAVVARLAVAGTAAVPTGLGYEGAKDVAFAVLGDVNGQAYVIMVGLPMALALALAGRGRLTTAAGGVTCALGAWALLSMASRSAMLGAAAGCLLVALLVMRRSPGRLAGLALLAGAGVYLMLPTLMTLQSDRSNLDSREDLWSTAIDLWRASPLLGHGPGSWNELVQSQARIAPEGGAGGAHQIFLQALASGGIGALLLQLLTIAVVVPFAWRALRGDGGGPWVRTVAIGASAGLVAILVRGIFEATGWPGVRLYDFRTWQTMLAWAMVGTLLACHQLATGARAPASGRAGGPP